MARAIELIERDLKVLQEAIRAIAAELYGAYVNYLTILGQALQKQLVLASYHLCTQGYPENFLSLSLNQRQQLQQAIRNLGQQAAELLLTWITSAKNEGDDAAAAETNVSSELTKIFTPNPSNPIELAKWQQSLEDMTQQVLKNVSHDANLLLQKASILPKKLPEPILEAAAAVSEVSADAIPGPPNLLNLVIEIENEQNAEDSTLTQIMAVNLRLGEIEFADATLSSSRRQIRHVLVQLNKLGREYQKKHRERSIAEAEAAWRASWFE